jgi:DNA-binding response OmpR family regulator
MTQSLTPLRALVADPSSHMAALIAQMLHSLKIRSVEATVNLERTASELGRRSYDLILLDEQIAGGEGFEMIRGIRQTADHSNRSTPIIMMAAAPDARMIAAARDAGVTEFLRKPFSAEHIRLRIEAMRAAPRPFVEAESYAGPDRRRKHASTGQRRRAGDAGGQPA